MTVSPWDERLRLGASFGISAERTPSLVGTFEQMEGRTETRFAQDGITPVGATHFSHVAAPLLQPATSRTWEVDARFALMPGLDLNASYLDRRGLNEIIVEPIGQGADGRLLLSSGGTSSYRGLELGLRYTVGDRTSLSAWWEHARARSDLNVFASLFGDSRAPVVRPNEYAPSDAEIPDRLVVRLRRRLRERWQFAALLDWRQGFPFSAVNENLDYVGSRNQAGRFPTSALLEISIERRFRIARWEPWLGLAVLNLLDSSRARDVQSNVTAPGFGTFYDRVPRRLTLIVRLGR
jgi:hypothetical protein